VSNEYDEKVNRLVLEMFKQLSIGAILDKSESEIPLDIASHLVACESLAVKGAEGQDGSYGCDTGCEYVTLEATLTCGHGWEYEFEYGEFGSMWSLLDDLDRLDKGEAIKIGL
jgi:hypothetical protein